MNNLASIEPIKSTFLEPIHFLSKFDKEYKRGAPSGLNHCLDIGCLRAAQNIPSGERHELCRAIHAEQNAIIQAALHGVSIKGATIYITNQPCVFCAKMIIQAGINRVVYKGPYPDQLALQIFEEAGTQLEVLGGK